MLSREEQQIPSLWVKLCDKIKQSGIKFSHAPTPAQGWEDQKILTKHTAKNMSVSH